MIKQKNTYNIINIEINELIPCIKLIVFAVVAFGKDGSDACAFDGAFCCSVGVGFEAFGRGVVEKSNVLYDETL